MLIIRRSNFINTAPGMICLCKRPSGAQVEGKLFLNLCTGRLLNMTNTTWNLILSDSVMWIQLHLHQRITKFNDALKMQRLHSDYMWSISFHTAASQLSLKPSPGSQILRQCARVVKCLKCHVIFTGLSDVHRVSTSHTNVARFRRVFFTVRMSP